MGKIRSRPEDSTRQGQFGEGIGECMEPSGLLNALFIPGSFIRAARDAAKIDPKKKPEIYTRAVAGELMRTTAYAAAIYSVIYSATH